MPSGGRRYSFDHYRPVSAAVKCSSLVAFLVDPRDPSEKVMNRIALAAGAECSLGTFSFVPRGMTLVRSTWTYTKDGMVNT